MPLALSSHRCSPLTVVLIHGFSTTERMYLRHSRSSFPRWLWFYWNKSPSIAGSARRQVVRPQERDCGAFARRAGHHIAGVFKETASGAKKRPVERNKVMTLTASARIGGPCVRNRTPL